MRNLYIILTIILAVCLAACNTPHPAVTSISDVKNILQSNSLTVMTGDSDLYVEGFYYKDPVPVLVTDLKYTRTNAIMPDSVYLVLPETNAIVNKLEPYQGQRIRVKGTIRKSRTKKNGAFIQTNEVEFIIKDVNALSPKGTSEIIAPRNIQLKAPFRSQMLPAVRSSSYALLYSGGYDRVNAHMRYWNDLKLMYRMLKTVYGYADDHILVIYKNGVGEDLQMPVSYAADPAGLKKAFGLLSSKINTQTNLFIFFTNHGGGYHKQEARNEGGINDISGDEVDPYRMDEVTYYYNQNNNIILDDEVAGLVNALPFKQLIVIMEPCFGGGFLRDLRGNNRMIISASSEFEFSYSNSARTYDVFSYFFSTAFTVKVADTDGDGKISVLEAYLFARSHDQTGESPEIEDNGDGIGSTKPSVSSSGDGLLASRSFLF